jgi:broad specificity phosphatase PhoE
MPPAERPIYLVRHGQTEFNRQRRHHGHTDSPLTALGKHQAHRAGQLLKGLADPSDVAIWSSPLGRAAHTATIIAQELGVTAPIVFDPDLREIGMGSAEGLLDAELPGLRSRPGCGNGSSSMTTTAPDGETLAALALRLDRALRQVHAHAAGSRIVVTHGVAARVIRGNRLGLDAAEAMRLEAPQDAMFRIDENRTDRLEY